MDRERAAQGLVMRLLDSLTWVVPLGLVALVASLIRARHAGGFWTLGNVHLALLLAATLVLILRKRLPQSVVLWSLAAVLIANGLANLIALGLASTTLLVLACAAVFVAVVFGTRAGLLAALAFAGSVAAVGTAVALGALPAAPGVGPYLRQPTTWLAQGTGFVLYTMITVVCVSAVQHGLARRAEELRREVEVRRGVERELREREQRYRLLAENLTDVLFIQDLDLAVVYTSPSVEAVLGYTVEEAKALRPPDLFTPESLARAHADFTHYLAAGEDPPLMEYEYLRKDGSRFWGELRISLLRDDGGRPVASQGLLRDVTERKRLEQENARLEVQLHQAEKLQAIGELAGGIAHDFNNQLTGIMGSAELLALQVQGRDELHRHLQQIMTAAERAADLTAKLTAFARRGQYRSVTVDLRALCEEVAGILERSIDRSIVITRRHADGPLATPGDPTPLQNALLNIALNARDAMPGGGELRFESEQVSLEAGAAFSTGMSLEPGRYVRISIVDTGVGMEPEVQRRIFEPFFTTKRPGRGTGMGLAAAYGTVNAHGGAIEVTSSPGAGTRFSVYLPAGEGSPPLPPAAREPTVLPVGSGTVLIVDDEPSVLAMTAAAVGRLGYQVLTCSDGNEAIACYREAASQIDLVVLDLILPGKSGAEVFAAIRALRPELPILLCSGHSLEQEVRGLLGQPGVGLLQKPFTLALLADAIQRLTPRRA